MESDDRSAQAAASGAANQASTTAGMYGGTAGGIAGSLIPQQERMLTTPTGISPTDLSMMETRAQENAAGVTGSLQENARLRAMRSRNLAGISGQQDAIAQAAARSAGQDIQDVLGMNAKLKAQQQQDAAKNLGGLYGEAMRGQLGAEDTQSRDIQDQIEAGKSGWLQNLTGVLGLAASPFRVSFGAGGAGGGG